MKRISVVFVGPAEAPLAGQGSGAVHADALSPASWTAIHSYLTGGVVAPRWDLAGYARLHSRGHAVRLMNRWGRHGSGGSCDGQNKSNSDQPDHCHLHLHPSCRFQHTPCRAIITGKFRRTPLLSVPPRSPRTDAPGRAKSSRRGRRAGWGLTRALGCGHCVDPGNAWSAMMLLSDWF